MTKANVVLWVVLWKEGNRRSIFDTFALNTDNTVGFPRGNCPGQIQEVEGLFRANVVINLRFPMSLIHIAELP